MKRYAVWVSLMLGLLALTGRAQGPDQTYLVIYNLIQDADAANTSGDPARAAAKYREAYSLLKDYPNLYPTWNEKVVKYRLEYLTSRLESLGAQVAPTNALTAAETNAPVAATNQLQALQDEITRLTSRNALLEAKLREALSVQPASADPRELARAEEKIKELQKEVDLLRVSLDKEPVPPMPDPTATAQEQEKQLLAHLKQEVARQLELNAALQKENADLKNQVAELKTQPPTLGTTTNASEELLVARAVINALQAKNIELRTERILLESRLEDLTRERAAAAAPQVKELEKERDELQKELAAANRALERRKSWAASSQASDTVRQLEAVLARLEVYEAEAVPYSPEELVLFRQADTNAPPTAPDAAKKTAREFPPGTFAIFAKAQQASQAGRYTEAEELYNQILAQDEKHLTTLASLAAVQIDQGRLGDAEQTLNKALAVTSRDPDILLILGTLRYQQGRIDDAEEALSLSAKLLPGEARTHYLLGRVLVEKGQRARAETAFRKALELKPGFGGAHHQLAVVYLKHQPPYKELAQWHYQRAQEADWPRDPDLEAQLKGPLPVGDQP